MAFREGGKCQAKGVGDISEMMGHSSVAFTLDTYSHVVPGLQKAAARRLDELLKPEPAEIGNIGKMVRGR